MSVSAETLEVPELVELGPIRWRGQVVFADPGFLLRAHLAYEQTLACGRCLNPIVESTEADVELMILVERADGRGAKGEEEMELHEDDLSLLVIPEELVDTGPLLVEQLQLNVPVKALCRPDCQGLCPECGADRNAGACSCGERVGDPRWASLAALKGRLEDGPR
ncbi:MAG TPA: DUF177 domain-containing protein [Thermoanaerobaculia bacterium]